MKIKEILSQHRRDFTAIYECENCKHEIKSSGYDDANYHQNVIPSFTCPECGKNAPDNYRALTTKYPEDYQV
jgi:predicted RNA-binding Zn-ribbon protein involved in translation (DUF1610 family)